MAVYGPIAVARFWSKVRVSESNAECWEWSASTSAKGYGRFKHNGWVKKAHRVAWEIFNDDLLGDRVARHACDNPRCCNPHHIEPGTVQDNVADMMNRGRHRAPSLAMEMNPRAKLTADDVRSIKGRISAGEPDSLIANDYPVTPSAIRQIRIGASWRLVQ